MQAQQLMSMQESDAPQPDQESFSCFVGDLSADVTDITLQETFRQFYPSVHCAKVSNARSLTRWENQHIITAGVTCLIGRCNHTPQDPKNPNQIPRTQSTSTPHLPRRCAIPAPRPPCPRSTHSWHCPGHHGPSHRPIKGIRLRPLRIRSRARPGPRHARLQPQRGPHACQPRHSAPQRRRRRRRRRCRCERGATPC